MSQSGELSELLKLVRRAKEGDSRALDALMIEVRQRMKVYFHRRASQIDSSDLAQDVSFTVARSLHQFEGNTDAAFGAWVMTIARNTHVDQIRHVNRIKRAGNEVPLPEGSSGGIRVVADDDTPSQIVQKREQEDKVNLALMRLTNDEQLVIRMRYFAEKDWAEIAEVLNKTEAATKKFYQRTMNKWRDKCQEE